MFIIIRHGEITAGQFITSLSWQVCDSGGQCSQSICTKYNMEPCGLPSSVPEDQCQISCMAKGRPKTCKVTAALTGLFAQPVHKPVNTPCALPKTTDDDDSSTGTGFCNSAGQCLDYTYQGGAGGAAAGVQSAGWVVGLAIFLVCYLILTVLALWTYCRYCRGQKNITIEVSDKEGSNNSGGSKSRSSSQN